MLYVNEFVISGKSDYFNTGLAYTFLCVNLCEILLYPDTMQKKFTLTGFLLFLYLFSNAQSETVDMRVKISRAAFQAKQIVPPAPEAAELGKYGNTPMSLFSGTANISIPPTELQGQSLSLPISFGGCGYFNGSDN